MADFWSDAEPSDEEKSKFESVTRIEERLQTLRYADLSYKAGNPVWTSGIHSDLEQLFVPSTLTLHIPGNSVD